MPYLEETCDIIVVGAGHTGREASPAYTRLGLETIMFTVSMDSIALMPYNPNVGGSSKGHLVQELGALSEEMGKNIDKSFIQSKMLNKSKGPAVHSLQAQADRQDYSRQMRKTLEQMGHLTIHQTEVSGIVVEDGKIQEVRTSSGTLYRAKYVVLHIGTYLKVRCIYGDASNPAGPNELQAANHPIDSLKANSVEMFRFRTGTPTRVDKKSIDFSKIEEQFGSEGVVPFSFSTGPESVRKEQVSCWLIYTNRETHGIIRDNPDRSPLFSGTIEGAGPRYCPFIEDKMVKFPDKDRHQVFVEPEGLYTSEMYLSGMSSSLPEDVQCAMYRTVSGLEHVQIIRNAYAIEYDCINALQLKPTLGFKKISDLYAGGQFNESPGYEEAAVQGFMADVNTTMKITGKDQVVLSHSQACIGMLIDDLVAKENHEPYRMMTSRAEYGLLLRQDNADIRLRKIGYDIGLVNNREYEQLIHKMETIDLEVRGLGRMAVGLDPKTRTCMEKYGSTQLKSGTTLAELIKRPELDYDKLEELDEERPKLAADVGGQVNIEIKYEGYIKYQLQQVEQFGKLENKKLPENPDYSEVNSLHREAVQKLNKTQPVTVGQASRISGVSPADTSVLLVHFTRKQRETVRSYMTETSLDRTKRELDQLGIRLSEYQMDQFFTYYEMLVEENKVMNLTTIAEEREVMTKHFSGSLSLFVVIQEMEGTGKQGVGWLENSRIIGTGIGAGFPGIPLKIVSPGIRVTLLDFLNKRIEFLKEICDALNLENVTSVRGRAESAGRLAKHWETYDLCVSRAIANLASLSEYCTPFIKVGGYFIPYKSGEIDKELVQTQRAIGLLGGEQKMVKRFLFPGIGAARSLVVIEKIKATPKEYPRKAGMPTRKPLK